MPHRAVAIANEFLNLPGARETLTQMQLQKLDFIANGWNMVINGDPLIVEDAEAWAYGPVYRDLYDHTKFFGKAPIGRPITPDDSEPARVFGFQTGAPPYRAHLTDREREVVRHVWHRYGSLTGIRLSELTHQQGTPWFETFMTQGRNARISPDLIRAHYGELAQAAGAAA
jgi:uncharacterized phage-associated protein